MLNITNPPFLKIVPIGAYNPNDGISTGWAMEISLDVEYAHIIAPDAGIVLYVANPNVPLPAIIAYIDQQDEVNVLSQSFGIPEVGDLTSFEIIEMIRQLRIGQIIGFDVVEVSPPYNVSEITSMLAANIIYEGMSVLSLSL